MDTIFANLAPGPTNLLTDVGGLSVGNAEDELALTGVSVVLAEQPAIASVDVGGGAPGTRETDALDPTCLVEAVDAVVLSGGSVYGLDAASGVTAWLGSRGRGYEIASAPIRAPIVPAAILFDLANGGDKSWGAIPPYNALGLAACDAASADFALGNAGAGLGATAGLYKGGLGSASVVANSGLAVGALVAVNAVGSPVIPGSDAFWAGPFEIDGEFGARPWARPEQALSLRAPLEATKLARLGGRMPANTTIAVLATNATLSPVEAKRIAIMAQDGFARALRPAHTPFDGDTVFVLATGKIALPEPRAAAVAGLGSLGADTLARAIARGVFEASGIAGIESYRDRHP